MDKVHIKKLCVSSVLPGLQCLESRKILPFWRRRQENIQMLCQVTKNKPVPLVIHVAG